MHERKPHVTDRAADRPNLLFVFPDQLGATYMGCYGHPQVRTPHLDALAAESVMFRRAYTASPLCTPFRGTLLTGRYPSQTGILLNSQRIAPSETPMAERFNEAGYQTCYVGKWHLAGPPRKICVPECERGGFQDFVGWDCGHVHHIDQEYFDNDCSQILTMPGHETDALTEIAIDRLRRHGQGEQPFCMVLSYQAPHPICAPPEQYAELYRGKPLALRPTVDRAARFTGYGHGRTDIPLEQWTEDYFAETTHLDAAVGRLLAKLDELGLRENTVVVFTSDHGDMGGCHGRFEKAVPNEEASHIPLMIRLPGQAEGRQSDALFSSVDFMPTVLSLCGLPAADGAEGVDYGPLVRGQAGGAARETLIMQCHDWAMIRRGDAKLTLGIDGTGPQALYRLDTDPYEERNLVESAEHRQAVAELQSAYVAWLRDAETRNGDIAAASETSPGLEGEDFR